MFLRKQRVQTDVLFAAAADNLPADAAGGAERESGGLGGPPQDSGFRILGFQMEAVEEEEEVESEKE